MLLVEDASERSRDASLRAQLARNRRVRVKRKIEREKKIEEEGRKKIEEEERKKIEEEEEIAEDELEEDEEEEEISEDELEEDEEEDDSAEDAKRMRKIEDEEKDESAEDDLDEVKEDTKSDDQQNTEEMPDIDSDDKQDTEKDSDKEPYDPVRLRSKWDTVIKIDNLFKDDNESRVLGTLNVCTYILYIYILDIVYNIGFLKHRIFSASTTATSIDISFMPHYRLSICIQTHL